jgi:hypothetical protein
MKSLPSSGWTAERQPDPHQHREPVPRGGDIPDPTVASWSVVSIRCQPDNSGQHISGAKD